MHRLVFALYLLQFAQIAVFCEVAFVVTETRCYNLSQTVLSHNCTASFQGRRSVLNVDLASRKDLYNLHMTMNIRVDLANNRKFEYRNLRLDLCNLLNTSKRSNIFGLVIERLKETAENIPNECPFKKNIHYGIRNFYMDPDTIVGFALRGRIMTGVEFFEGSVKLLRFKMKSVLCDVEPEISVENITSYCAKKVEI